jgi:DNA-binding NarL/FixJ family response regulator
VVIVDDHGGFRAWARAFLESEGYRVVGEAVDGRSAICEVSRLRPDVVLLDIQLPDVDGFEVARRVAGLPRPSVVVLISSREAADYGPRLAEASGVRAFISKVDLSAERLHDLVDGAS